MANTLDEQRPRVFISYSRKDTSFANQLSAALLSAGLDAFVDAKEIVAAESWRDRLDNLIVAADAVIAVISPDFLASPVCQWEIERAQALAKRVLPVVLHRVEPAQIPDQLGRLNAIYFDDPTTFETSLNQLVGALRGPDLGWIREHTRYSEMALRWNNNARVVDYLLSGEEIRRAQNWVSNRPSDLTEVSTLILEFIQASSAHKGQVQADYAQLIAAQTDREKELVKREQELEKRRKQVEDELRERTAQLELERDRLAHRRRRKGIFINYRREDTAPWAGWICERLLRNFRREQLFIDVDTIQKGRDFTIALDEHLAGCSVMLAIVGKQWLEARTSTGERRLDDPNDYVRREITTALKSGIAVIPLLIDGARLPRPEQLPADLHPLLRRQASSIDYESFQRDIEGLKRDIYGYVRSFPTWLLALGSLPIVLLAAIIVDGQIGGPVWRWIRSLISMVQQQ